jgi:pyruvate,water dikinase
VLDIAIGDKRNVTVPEDEGGTVMRAAHEARRTARALSDAQLRELTRLALRVEAVFGDTPQDVEFAIADGRYWILQARPITNLPPPPLRDVRWEPPIPGSAWIRRQVVENMPQPLSPLFAELYLHEGLDQSIESMYSAFNISDSINRLVDRPLFTTVHGYAYMRANINFALSIVPILVRAYANGLPAVFNIGPGYWRDQALPRYLDILEHWKSVDHRTATSVELLRGVRELAWGDAIYWFAAAVAIGAAKVSEGVLSWFLATALPGRGLTSGLFLRGFPSKTLEAEAAFERLARRLRESESGRRLVESVPATQLLERLREDPETRWFDTAFSEYLDRYGHQIYNLDFVEPTQAEDPLALLLSLKRLIATSSRDVEGRRLALARERDESVESIVQTLDPVRGWLFRRIVGWAQQYAPYREEALFYVGAAWPTLRRLALELGRRLTENSALDRPADVFFLETREIEAALAGTASAELARDARARRDLREARKRLHPPAAVPPEHRLKLGPIDISLFETQQRNVDQTPVLHGFAVSPGRVTAAASLIRSPADFERMQPDSILVCPTTTPAWTPLFAQARGLVTDVGGILAHGSIVAREYGIPAVMGTGVATQRIEHGQVITVDGDSGSVSLTEDVHVAPTKPLPEKRTRMPAALIGVGLGLGLALLVGRHRQRRRRGPSAFL